MKRKKGLKKFNISNRLAYTLMVILSIALLGIGVYAGNPSYFGHNAQDLNLDWGSVSGCTGSVYDCSFYNWDQSGCASQDGCYYGCMGGEFPLDCGMFRDSTSCWNNGCTWDGFSCSGTGPMLSCSMFPASECGTYPGYPSVITPCYPGCGGDADTCSTFITSSGCDGQGGCDWTTIQRTITNSSKGINIPNLNVNLLCDSTGTNCVEVKAVEAFAANFYTGRDSMRREMRRDASVTCPSGSYLYSVRIIDEGNGEEAHLEGSCRTLPV